MKVGLVFAGGGGKGSYQIGVWKALNELGIDKKIGAVSGTSIGCLNAALFLNGDYETAYGIWCNISNEKILTMSDEKLYLGDKELEITLNDNSYFVQGMSVSSTLYKKISKWPNLTKGIFSREGILSIINNNLRLEHISNSEILGFANCTLIPFMIPNYFQLNGQPNKRLESILLASSAFPIAFGVEKINGYYFLDGGLTDNIPIKPIYIRGYKNIIVVNLNIDDRIDKFRFPNSNIIEITPTKDLGSLITGTFDFSKEHAIKRIEQGYNDAMNLKQKLISL